MSNKKTTMVSTMTHVVKSVVNPMISSVLSAFKPNHIDQGNDCCLYKNNKIKKLKETTVNANEIIKKKDEIIAEYKSEIVDLNYGYYCLRKRNLKLTKTIHKYEQIEEQKRFKNQVIEKLNKKRNIKEINSSDEFELIHKRRKVL